MASTAGCPSTNTIAELVCRRLADARVVEVEAHVADCATCRRIVGTLAAASLPSFAEGSLGGETGAEVAAQVPADRYVLREELARGGMGRISIAEDTLLGRTVAIKQLIAPSPSLAARFRRELALTARLQHPSIVSVHDGGTLPGGEPFYVMRLVSGEPLDRAIARCADLPARLGLLPHGIAVVDALAYAHGQDVVHRDLKPANVLVGDFGETVVIDWGLARDLRGDEAERAVVGTPAYMAPEQARGEPVDARGDIYALGALIYHLLAGEPPYDGTTASGVVRAVEAAAPMPLAERAPGTPVDLLAIVGKAMARRPEDRYASAAELAADLKRFQRGQLVAAHRYSRRQLVRRWVGRHRAAVAVGAIAIAVVSIGGTASVRRILAERQSAEQSRGDAEELMTFMLTDLRDKLKPIGKLELLDTVARKARDYYDHRPDQGSTGAALARFNLGQVLQERGDHQGALAQFQGASELIATHAEDPDWAWLAAANHRHLGETLELEGKQTEALAEYREALAIDERRGLFSNSVLGDLAQSHGDVGRVLGDRGDTAGALPELRAAAALADAYEHTHPNAVEAPQLVFMCRINLGYGLEAAGNVPAALAVLRRAEALAIERTRRAPGDAVAQRDRFLAGVTIGHLLEVQGDDAGALAELRNSSAIAEQLVARDPTSLIAQRDFSGIHNDLGDALLAQGDVAGALESFREGQRAIERVAAQTPDDLGVRLDAAVSASRVGDALLQQHDVAGALHELEASLAATESLAALDRGNASVQAQLALAHYDVGRARQAAGDKPGALAAFRAARELAGKLAASDPENADVKHTLQIANEHIAALGEK